MADELESYLRPQLGVPGQSQADPLESYRKLLGGGGWQQAAPNPPPSEEEQSSWLGKTLGAAQYVGESLGKFGAAERGVISGLTGGDWGGGLLNLIPFSDTLGITDPKQRVTGSDLLERMGLPSTGHDAFDWKNGYDWLHAGLGFATDLATDPLLQFGAGIGTLTKAGADAAKAAAEAANITGKSAEAITAAEKAASLAGEASPLAVKTLRTPMGTAGELWSGERALLGGKILGTDIRWGINPTGLPDFLGGSEESRAANAAWLWEKANYSKLSPLEWIRGTFSNPATGGKGLVYDPVVQMANDRHALIRNQLMNQYKNLETAFETDGRDLNGVFDGMMQDAGKIGDKSTQRTLSELMRTWGENYGGVANKDRMAKELGDIMGLTPHSPIESLDQTAAFAGRIHDHLDGLITLGDVMLDKLTDAGVDMKELEDAAVGWMPRSVSAFRGSRFDPNVKAGAMGEANGLYKNVMRANELRGLPSQTISDIMQDGFAAGHKMLDEEGNPLEHAANLSNKVHKASLQQYFRDAAADAYNAGNNNEGSALAELSSSGKLSVLRANYINRKYVEPGIDKAWAEAAHDEVRYAGTTLDPETGEKIPAAYTKASEKARWLNPAVPGKGVDEVSPTYDLIEKLDQIKGQVLKETGNIDGLATNGLYDQSPLHDMFRYLKSGFLRLSTINGAHTLLTQDGVIKVAGDAAAENWPKALDAWTNAKLATPGLQTWVRNNMADDVVAASKARFNPEANAAEALAAKGITGDTAQEYLPSFIEGAKQSPKGVAAEAKAVDDVIENLRINPSAAKALEGFSWVASPKNENPLTRGMDNITSAYKTYLYGLFPNSWARNVGSHFFLQAQRGTVEKGNLFNLAKHYGTMAKYLSTQDASLNEFIPELAGVFEGKLPGQMQDVIGAAASAKGGYEKIPTSGLESIIPNAIQQAKERPGGWLTRLGKAINPGAVPGFAEPGNYNLPVEVGLQVQKSQMVIQQGALYLTLREQGMSPAAAKFEAQVCAMSPELTSEFDRTTMRRLIPFFNFWRCVPDHSEILTQDGWKTCDSLLVGDLAMTYNLEKDELEWQPVDCVNVFPCNGSIAVFESARVRLEFTVDHRWPIFKRGSEQRAMLTLTQFDTQSCFIQAAPFNGNERSALTPEQARLIGWLLTDGTYRWRPQWGKGKKSDVPKAIGRPKRGESHTTWPPPDGTYIDAVIYQSPKKFLEEVKEVAGGHVGAKPNRTSGAYAIQVLPDRLAALHSHLRHSKDDPYWPKLATRLSREAAEAMYDAMYKADGTTSANRTQNAFSCLSHPNGVGQAFQVLAIMLGKSARPNGHGFYVSDQRHIQLKEGVVKLERYNGRVWCPTTPNGTWVMRQNGIVTITGNSNVPFQLSRLLEAPGGLGGQTMQAMSRIEGQKSDIYTPSFLREQGAMPVGADNPQAQGFFRSTVIPFGDLNDLVMTKNLPNVGRSLEKVASRLNPLLLAGPELAAGRQFATGRKISDLQSPTEAATGTPIPIVDRLIHYSPASRAEGALWDLFDKRKSWGDIAENMTGMGRISHYDVEAQKLRDLRDAYEKSLEQNPDVKPWTNYFVPKTKEAQMTPEELQQTHGKIKRREQLTKRLAALAKAQPKQ